eukprot:620539-Pelagomonas_calceolata.AAC.1
MLARITGACLLPLFEVCCLRAGMAAQHSRERERYTGRSADQVSTTLEATPMAHDMNEGRCANTQRNAPQKTVRLKVAQPKQCNNVTMGSKPSAI